MATARILISRTGKNQANLIEKFVPWLVKNNLPYTKGKSKVTKEKITKSPLIYTKKEKANKSPLIYTKEDKKPKGSKRELFIKNKLQTPFVATTKDKPTIHILISEICNHFGVVSDAVISKGRDVELVVVRDIICYLSHVYLDYSYQSI